ncbi:MAG: ABC transporter substrate-binding protein [Bacteroidota bacterium]|nr:ABC transporter substrate-binding protein [Bacteroidota bacterium]
MSPIKIGLLAYNSSVYPYAHHDFVNGFYTAFPSRIAREYFQFIPEFIKAPTVAHVKESVQKLLGFDQVDILSGLISYKAVPDIVPLVERQKKMAFFYDMGELIPYTQHISDHFFFNSFQYWQSEYALGYWAFKEFGDKGSVVMSLYDAGYHLQSAFRQGAIAAGSQEIDYCVLHDNPTQSQVKNNARLLFEKFKTTLPSFIHAIFCGSEVFEFLEEFNQSGLKGKIPLLVTAHMASEEIVSQVTNMGITMYAASMYNYYSPDKLNLQFKQAFETLTGQKANAIALMGYEMGLAMAHLLPELQKRDWPTIIKLLKKETVRSPRGERNFYLDSDYAIPTIDIEKIEVKKQLVNKMILAQGKALKYNHYIFEEIHRENVTGWQNPYLCV